MAPSQPADPNEPLVALVSVYDRCKDILRSVGHEWYLNNYDQKALQARISTEHQRLEQWGHGIGLDGPKKFQLSSSSDGYLLNHDFHESTQGILESIVSIFEETIANLVQHYELAPSSSAPTTGSARGGYLARIQSFLAAKNPTSRWQRQDKVRFVAFAETVHHHVGVLLQKLDYFESVANV
uniref:Prion-inhibition and propagation HeLo domain-containing protein n=1 Tax=Bionectria ochroleuca TaxID=29856 RepID=A0A8H7NH35_BIOOC